MKKDKGVDATPDRVTYSESIKVNIGDYESRDFFVSVSSDVQEGETVKDAIIRVKKQVQPQVNLIEKKTRLQSKGNVDFDTMAKLRD